MTPFILLGRKRLPSEDAPLEEHVYDEQRQLWIEKNSGLPLVSGLRTYARQTQYGETTMTETREGVDQTEGASALPSEFGETVHTRTGEGIDQPDVTTFLASQLGETSLTKTHEGADQTEGAADPFFDAPHSHF